MPYTPMHATDTVGKPYQTRPAKVGTKGGTEFFVSCTGVATTEALFKLEGAIAIQRYCDRCLPQTHYQTSGY